MTKIITLDLAETGGAYSLPRRDDAFDRAAICRRAHAIKHERRQKLAERTFAAEQKVVAGRPYHARSFEQVLQATPYDFSAAMKAAWNEAKTARDRKTRRRQGKSRAITLAGGGALATIGAKLSVIDLAGLLAGVAAVARWLDGRFMPSRTAGAAPLVITKRIQ